MIGVILCVDEGDEIRDTGSAEIMDNGDLEIELSFFDGDDAILIAEIWGQSPLGDTELVQSQSP